MVALALALALAIGGWFAAPTISKLLEKLSSHALKLWESKSGLKDELQKLKVTLLKIQPVIAAAEEKHINSDSLLELLRELKAAAYDADDLLDDFEYQGLKLIVEASNNDPLLPSKEGKHMIKDVTSRVSGYFSSKFNNPIGCFTCQTSTSTFKSKSPTEDEIKRIVDRLDYICTGVREIVGLPNNNNKQHETWENIPQTTSFLEQGKLHGRVEEKEKIIKLLLDSGDASISVIPIVGMGGMGKTTLAQHVYNDRSVAAHFKRVWVYVSQNFDELKITREIIVSLSEDKDRPHDLHQITSLDSLQQTLMQKLKGVRFILVLDDVWTDKWTSLLTPLKYAGEKGSKVVVTCRQEEDLGGIGMDNKIQLGDLEGEACSSLFMEHAFGGLNPSDFPILQDIGRQIAEKLTGSPLEAKVVGGMLKRKMDTECWRNILENGIWALRSNENRIVEVLRQSYKRLDVSLQQCFAYCSVFPKGYVFDKDMLVRIWIALDFIRKERNKRIEDTGREHFDNLLCSSFFNHHYEDHQHYVMHDLMNDLAMSVSKDECFRIEGDRLGEIPLTVRHLYFRIEHLAKLRLCQIENLRSFLCDGYKDFKYDYYLVPDIVKKLKHVRVLVFDNVELEPHMLVGIGELIHVRYLKHPSNTILPESLCKLYHLQVESFSNNVLSVSEGIKNLINLRHILPVNCFNLSNIANLGHLTSLQELTFTVQKKSGHEIVQLKDMRELEKLEIRNLENVEGKGVGTEAKLYEKKYLAELSLNWDYQTQPSPEAAELVLKGLEPHRNLKELSISGYGGCKSPTWMSWLSNLNYLHLSHCPLWEVLPPLGQLGSLKDLHIEFFEAVKHVDHTFYGSSSGPLKGFPSLESLKFGCMSKWEEWSGVDQDCLLFPHLRELYIEHCPKLKRVPTLPPSLTRLDINQSGLIALPRMAEESNSSPSSLSELNITGCHNLNSLGENLLQQYQLTVLERLVVKSCHGLTSLGCLRSLISLKLLMIEDCPKLTVNFPEEDEILPSSIQVLNIQACPELKRLPTLPLSLKILKISQTGLIALQRMAEESNSSSPSSLSRLNVRGCHNLNSVGESSLQQHQLLRALEDLDVKNCPALTSLGCLRSLISLKKLSVEDCPKLTVNYFPEGDELLLPLSIQKLRIENGGDLGESLPRYMQALTSLSNLKISSCAEITSLPSVEVFRHLLALKKLRIHKCEQLTSLGGLQAVGSLRYLTIEECPKLTASLTLPTSLVGLEITRVVELDTALPRFLENLTSFSSLEISECPQIISLPNTAQLQHLTALKKLRIADCEELKSLGGFQALISLEDLSLVRCPNLTAASWPLEEGVVLTSSLQSLQIEDISLLTAPQLTKSLASLRVLTFTGCPQGTSFTDEEECFRNLTSLQELRFSYCESLQSLPTVLHSLSALKKLIIWGCHELKSLPDSGLPTSLTTLIISNCKMLEYRCRVGGDDRDKIAHIPCRVIW